MEHINTHLPPQCREQCHNLSRPMRAPSRNLTCQEFRVEVALVHRRQPHVDPACRVMAQTRAMLRCTMMVMTRTMRRVRIRRRISGQGTQPRAVRFIHRPFASAARELLINYFMPILGLPFLDTDLWSEFHSAIPHEEETTHYRARTDDRRA